MSTVYILFVTLSFSTGGASKLELNMPAVAQPTIEACVAEGEKKKIALKALDVSYVCRPFVALVNGYN